MPSPIPTAKVLETALSYLVRRQLQGRPTSVRNLSKRMGLGGSTLLAKMRQEEGLEFMLVQHSEEFIQGKVEILIRDLPPFWYGFLGVDAETLKESFDALLPEGAAPLEDDPTILAPEEVRISDAETLDPYHPYRITEEQFYTLRPHLITSRELFNEATKRGYSSSAISRATGGDRMRFKIVGPLWRPYIYQGKRYFLREVLSVLEQSYKSYKFRSTATRKRLKRERANARG